MAQMRIQSIIYQALVLVWCWAGRDHWAQCCQVSRNSV